MVKIGFLAKNIPISSFFIIFRPIFLKIVNLEKLIFPKMFFFVLMGILTPGSIKIERSMQKYFRGLILRFFGLIGGPLVPREGPS